MHPHYATFLASLLALTLVTDTDARRYRYYKVVRKPAPVKVVEPETKTVRIIPIIRWQTWCDRIGGSECP